MDTVVVDVPLLTDFVDASRTAESFPEALRIALDTLRDRLGATSVMLLDDIASHRYLLNRLELYPYPLPMGDEDIQAWLRWAESHQPQYVAEIKNLGGIGARLALCARRKTLSACCCWVRRKAGATTVQRRKNWSGMPRNS
jgi:hypothetical protein